MSELTTCNYCTWKSMQRQGCRKATTGEREQLWRMRPNDICNGGVVIVNREGEFACWFMELPDHCTC